MQKQKQTKMILPLWKSFTCNSKSNPNYRLNYVVFGVKFNNTEISFCKDAINVFSPQFLPIYINPRNDKIQSYYTENIEERNRKSFLKLLQKESRSIVLE